MIGQKIKELRLGTGETVFAVSMATKIPPSTIQRIECGSVKDPRISTAKKLADHFGVRVDELVGEDGLK